MKNKIILVILIFLVIFCYLIFTLNLQKMKKKEVIEEAPLENTYLQI